MFCQPKDQRKSSNHDYKAYVQRLGRNGNFFLAPLRYFQTFKCRTAVFLLHALNVFGAKHTDDGFAQLTPRFVEDGIGIPADVQEKILRDLHRLGIVEVEKLGYPKTRHVRLDLDRLEEVLAQGGTGGKAA
jgi:hypothetical protein